MLALGILGLVILCGLSMCCVFGIGFTIGHRVGIEFILDRKPKEAEKPVKTVPILRRTISEY